ncbi:MAG: hypothetical protein IJR82_00525 [Bacilli bacterium]|nr:hypothetical protein [Bacilli bacterium]
MLIESGLRNKRIVPFDGAFYEQLNQTIINGLPVSIYIRYLQPLSPPGKCYDRSLYMFLCFDNALLVRGDEKDLEFLYGIEEAGHGWIEIENYVYDPSLMMRFDKDLYYKIYQPSHVFKKNKEQYCKDEICKTFYDDVRSTTLKDYQPNGRKRIELLTLIPLVERMAQSNQEFKVVLDRYLASIQYDSDEIKQELNNKLKMMP